MEPIKEIFTDEEIKKKAYLEGLRLKKTGLDTEGIYARLEKQGIPEELAWRVAKDIRAERKKDVVNEVTPFYHIALFRIGIGIAIAIIFAVLSPGSYILPIGFIAGGAISALVAKQKMDA